MANKRIVFSCFTPFHLFTAMYYSKQFCDCERILIWQDMTFNKININEFCCYFDRVLLNPISNSRIRKLIDICNYGGLTFFLSNTYKYLKVNNNNNIFIYFSDENFATIKQIEYLKRSGKNNIFILVEEGVGIYKKYKSDIPLKYKIPLVMVGANTSCNYIGASLNADFVFAKHVEKIDTSRFGKAKIVGQSDFLLSDSFTSNIREMLLKELNCDSKKPYILLLGDPCEEDGIDRLSYNSVIQNIVNILNDDFSILIKKHPRESFEFYRAITGAQLLENEFVNFFPVELIAKSLDIHIIITHVSSAASNIYDVDLEAKIIYFYKVFDSVNFDDSVFLEYSKNPNVYVVDNLANIKEIVNYRPIRRFVEKKQDDDIRLIRNILDRNIIQGMNEYGI